MLTVRLPVNKRLLVVKFLGSQKLCADFRQCRELMIEPSCCLRVNLCVCVCVDHPDQDTERLMPGRDFSYLFQSITPKRNNILPVSPSIILPVFNFIYVKSYIWCSFVSDYNLLNTTRVQFTHAVARCSSPFIFITAEYSIIGIHHNSFIHSPFDGRLDCVLFQGIVNTIAMNVLVHVF